jgi:hypothetical protein
MVARFGGAAQLRFSERDEPPRCAGSRFVEDATRPRLESGLLFGGAGVGARARAGGRQAARSDAFGLCGGIRADFMGFGPTLELDLATYVAQTNRMARF